jgi:mRNA-degrading endonuclease RelE of RelBE toxin-antitoxin system
MNFNIVYTKAFAKEFKRLTKKHPSIKSDFSLLLDELEKNPLQGEALGNNCFKIRLSVSSKGKGKRGGARVITCVKVVRKTIYLVSIYDKSEKATISNREIQNILKPYIE